MTILCDTLNDLISNGNIKEVIITVSLDCWGESQKYLRTGLNLKQTDDNLTYISNTYPNIYIHVHGTITALTIPTISDLVYKIVELNKARSVSKVTADWSLVEEYEHLHPKIMPVGFYDVWLDELINILDTHNVKYNVKTKFETYKQYLNSVEPDFEKINELVQYLDKLDARRNTNWRNTFPWFADFVDTDFISNTP